MKRARILCLFGKDTTGVTAVEFAILLPVMLVLLLASFDIARAVDVKNKAALLSRTVSDFVSQGPTITPTELNGIVLAARSVMYPYSSEASVLSVRIESIRQLANGNYVIDWSYNTSETQGGPATYTKVDDPNPPFTPPDTSVVLAEVDYTYNLKFSGFLVERLGMNRIELNSSTYMSPRWGTPVEADW